jgi:hypothetical protein
MMVQVCDELSQCRNGDASKVERKPVQLVVLIQESKAKEERGRKETRQLADGLICIALCRSRVAYGPSVSANCQVQEQGCNGPGP